MDWEIKQCKKGLKGCIVIPPDKSISHRAIMFGALSSAEILIKNFLYGEDCLSTFNAFKNMGIDLRRDGSDVIVKGKGLNGLKAPKGDLYLGNSGTTMRIISWILAGQEFDTVLTGDESLSSRPMSRIMAPLREMGADITDIDGGNHAPLKISGSKNKLKSIQFVSPVASAQVKSCILSAGLYADGFTTVTEPFQSRDHTERMLKYFNADIETDGLSVTISGKKPLISRDVKIPGDISSAAFFIVAGLLVEGSDIILKDVGLNPTRIGLINVLKRMGASIDILDLSDDLEPAGDLRIKYSDLKGTTVTDKEIPLLIDEVPILMVAALRAEGKTYIDGIKELKLKESDRILTMKQNLVLLGAEIEDDDNSVSIKGINGAFKSAGLDSFRDHRIAMSMAIAALLSDDSCTITNTACVDTSYPGFIKDLVSLSE